MNQPINLSTNKRFFSASVRFTMHSSTRTKAWRRMTHNAKNTLRENLRSSFARPLPGLSTTTVRIALLKDLLRCIPPPPDSYPPNRSDLGTWERVRLPLAHWCQSPPLQPQCETFGELFTLLVSAPSHLTGSGSTTDTWRSKVLLDRWYVFPVFFWFCFFDWNYL